MILAVSVNNTGYTNRIRAKKSEKLQNKYSTIAFKGGENPKQYEANASICLNREKLYNHKGLVSISKSTLIWLYLIGINQ